MRGLRRDNAFLILPMDLADSGFSDCFSERKVFLHIRDLDVNLIARLGSWDNNDESSLNAGGSITLVAEVVDSH